MRAPAFVPPTSLAGFAWPINPALGDPAPVSFRACQALRTREIVLSAGRSVERILLLNDRCQTISDPTVLIHGRQQALAG